MSFRPSDPKVSLRFDHVLRVGLEAGANAVDNVRDQLNALARVARQYTQIDAPAVSKKRAFLYILADRYVHGNINMKRLVVLLLKHKGKDGKFLCGVPGGRQEQQDAGKNRGIVETFEVNARREFAEEFLGIEKDQNKQKRAKASKNSSRQISP